MNIDPRGMTVIEWTDRMWIMLDKVTLVERLDNPDEWQDWAEGLSDSPSLEGQNIPDPYAFDDWREWAMRYNQVVELPG